MPSPPCPGDRLVRALDSELLSGFQHHGVFLGSGMVYENAKGVGERIVGFEEFSRGKAVQIIETAPEHRITAVLRAWERSSQPSAYNIALFNCEHGVTAVVEGDAHSEQVAQVALLAILIGALLLAPTA